MTTTLRPVALTEPRPAKVESASLPAIAADAPQPVAPQRPAHQENASQGKHQVRFDDQAARFVHTMTDAESQETIWSYPSESQLAYARAVMAYLRALSSR